VTNDLARRVYEHKSKAGAGFTARHGVDRLVWFECYDDPVLIEQENPNWSDLYGTIAG
jgi:putative endonuclease